MRLLAILLLAGVVGCNTGWADARILQNFEGTDGNASTALFNAPDKWELLWFSPRATNLTVLSKDGTVVAGSRGTFGGSMYMPKGGDFYVQIANDRPEMRIPWRISIVDVSKGWTLPSENNHSSGATGSPGTFGAPNDTPYAAPATILPPGSVGPAATTPASPSAYSQGVPPPLSTPVPNNPVGSPPSTPAPAAKLSGEQSRAVVMIKGDNSEGTGFLVKTAEGPFVITNIHVISNNPNLKVLANSGAIVKVLAIRGASDRDLAMLSIQDAGYSYLEASTEINKAVQVGDEVVTPGNSQGGEVVLSTGGKVLGIGPQRIEIDNPVYHGNSGGPVFHTKSGKVLGVVTEARKVDTSDEVDKASFANRNSAISSSMRYFALRLDTVTDWIQVDWDRLQIETLFLDQFHQQSRMLDAFLSGEDRDNPNSGGDSRIYMKDERIVKAGDHFGERMSGGADTSSQIQARRTLIFDLTSIVETNLNQIEDMKNFYPFDQERARDEAAYRKALKREIERLANNVERMGHLPRTNK